MLLACAQIKAQLTPKAEPAPPRHPRVIIVPEAKRKKYYDKERRIKELVGLSEAKATKEFKTQCALVQREFGLSRRQLESLLTGYIAYRDAYGEECAVDFFVPNIPRHPSVAELDPEAQKQYMEKEQYFKELLAVRAKNDGELPHRKRKEAAEYLKVTPRRVTQLLTEYVAYAEVYGAEFAVDYFRPLVTGRKAGTTMSELQQAAVRFGLLKRARMVVVEDEIHVKDIEYSLLDVCNFARAICDNAGEPLPSNDTVGRFIKSIKKALPTIHELGLWGKDAVERKLIPKRVNNVSRADARWQSDARDFPLYALVDGEPCPVCLLIIYDDYTGYIIWWKLVPKIYREGGKRPRRNSFTLRDVCSLLATAMYITNRMPDEFYTDNGSQFKALRALLSFLINSQGKFPLMVNSRPGQPWGRGKVERALGRVNALLNNLPGGYQKGKRETILKARKDALPLEQIIKIFAEHFDHVNKRPQGRKPSRHEQYWGAISSPRPAFAKLVHLELESVVDWVPMNHWGFNAFGQAYEPKLSEVDSNSAIYRLWLDAGASPKLVRMYALKLDVGWRIEIHLVGEKEEAWLEAVPKVSQHSDKALHNHDQKAALKSAVSDWRAIQENDEALIRAHCRVMPELNPATGQYSVPAQTDIVSATVKDSDATPPNHKEPVNEALPEQAATGLPSPQGDGDGAVTRESGASPTKKRPRARSRAPQVREESALPPAQSSTASDVSDLPDIDELTERYRLDRVQQGGKRHEL